MTEIRQRSKEPYHPHSRFTQHSTWDMEGSLNSPPYRHHAISSKSPKAKVFTEDLAKQDEMVIGQAGSRLNALFDELRKPVAFPSDHVDATLRDLGRLGDLRSAVDELLALGRAAKRDLARPRGSLLKGDVVRSPSATSFLEQTIENPDLNSAVRTRAALGLGEWGGEDSVASLVGMALLDETPVEVRLACVRSLGRIGGAAAARVLLSIVRTDIPDSVREAAASAVRDLALEGEELWRHAPNLPDLREVPVDVLRGMKRRAAAVSLPKDLVEALDTFLKD